MEQWRRFLLLKYATLSDLLPFNMILNIGLLFLGKDLGV